MQQTKGNIYLAEQRGCSQLEWFQSLHTFNFGNYFDESRVPFGALQVFNEETLLAGKSFKMQVEEDAQIIILPILGGIEFKQAEDEFIATGELFSFFATVGTNFEIINPYETETIKFLHIWIKNQSPQNQQSSEIIIFDVLKNSDQLLTLYQGVSTISIGKYSGRKDDIYKLQNPKHGVFAFVISGAFEFQNRLLHAGDGLSLWEVEEIDFEALSNDALVLILEIEL